MSGEMGFAFGEEGVGAFLHVHGGKAFAEGLLFAGEAVLHAGAIGPGWGEAGGERAAVVVGAGVAAEGIGFPGGFCSAGGVAATACAAVVAGAGVAVVRLVGAMVMGAVVAVGVVVAAAAVGQAVAGGDIGAFDHAGDGEGRFPVDDRQNFAGLC